MQPEPIVPTDTKLRQEVERLHRLTVQGRWLVVAVLWLTIGSFSLWGLRYPISLLQEHFTWAAVRYGLVFNRLPAFGLIVCTVMTISALLWQSRLWFGVPPREQQRLQQQVCRIRQQGPRHPLWRFVCKY